MKNEILRKCIELMEEEQRVLLYEAFNGGTFDERQFNQWINEITEARE